MKKKSTITAGIIATTCLLAIGWVLWNNSSSPARQSGGSPTSRPVADLLKLLPNLADLGIERCGYAISSKNHYKITDLVPSPSDIECKIDGWFELSPAGREKVFRDYVWKPIDDAQIPRRLKENIPAGGISISEKFNDTFNQNGTYAHGFVAAIDDNYQKLFFVASDMDHPITVP